MTKKVKKTKKVEKKKLSYMKLRRKLDKVFSIYIRMRDKGVCFTCGVQKPWKQMQAGHYISRSSLALRFDEKNVHCQCMPCNVWKHGAMDVYALKLQAKYGDSILAELQRKKHQITKYTNADLEALIAIYETRSKLALSVDDC